MKKSTLALSVAAAIGSFGFIGNAMAIGEFGVGFNLTSAGIATAVTAAPTAATSVRLNTDGIGHTLVVPYFSAQNANATLLNITNTDIVNGKVVKIRFRGAANSDDLFDFTVLLSPGDVWTGAVSQDPTTGLSLMKTSDASCALPASVKNASGQVFITGRVDPTPAKGSAINETREGYIEIITMADIPPVIVTTAGVAPVGPITIAYSAGTDAQKAASLFGTTKHVGGVAPCSASVLNTRVGSDPATLIAANNQGMSAPTGLLAADWVILNQTNTAAWSGSATALQAVVGTANAATNLVFWPQKDIASLGAAPRLAVLGRIGDGAPGLMDATADPLFTSGAVVIQPFDLPDLSTPLLFTTAPAAAGGPNVATETAAQRANLTSDVLAVTSIRNGFVTNSGIAGVTDFLFSQPTRRYSVAVNYTAPGTASAVNDLASGGTRSAAIYRGHVASAVGLANATAGTGSKYYGLGNTALGSVTNLTQRQVCLTLASPTFFDREETQVSGSFVISPGVASPFALCGETAVASINAAGVVSGSSLNATVVRNDVTFGTGFDLGWATFSTTNGNTGATVTGVGPLTAPTADAAATALPIVGSAFVRVANGAVNYGFTTAHKVSR